MLQLQLCELDISCTALEIEEYIDRFSFWCDSQENLSEKASKGAFLTTIGGSAYSLVKTILFPKSLQESSLKEIQSALIKHFEPVNFEAAERARFNLLVRDSSETIRDFVLKLQKQASKCNFGDQLQDALRDRLIAGINNTILQKKMLLADTPTFSTLRTLCQKFEELNKTVEVPTVMLHNAQRQPKFASKSSAKIQTFKSTNSNTKEVKKLNECFSCGGKHYRSECKFRNAKCNKCHKTGHIQRVCRSSAALIVNSKSDFENIDTEITDEFQSLTLCINSSEFIYKQFISSAGRKQIFILDTASTHSLINLHDLKQFYPNATITPTKIQITAANHGVVPLIGETTIPIFNELKQLIDCKFQVQNNGFTLLGVRVMRSLGVEVTLLVSDNPTTKNDITKLLNFCEKAAGGMKIPAIHLAAEGEPVFMKRRILPYGLRDLVQNELYKLVDEGILKPVTSSRWATPIVTPLKKDGVTPRICGDYRITMNKVLKNYGCTTDEPEDILNKMVNATVFSTIDLKNAYLQLPLDAESSKLTTITTPFGLFQYQFLPFGLSASPAIFQKVIDSIIGDISGVVAYQDDLIIFGKDQITHDQTLLKLLRRLVDKNVRINSNKCAISKSKINCLGYTFDGSVIRPDADRLTPLVQAPSPTTFTSLHSIISAIQYHSRFIPNFAAKADSLFKLQSQTKFYWTDEHEKCLRNLLAFLKTDAVVRPYSMKSKPTLITDASVKGLGAVLEQNGHPVICIARRLTSAEEGYSQTVLEALAIHWSIQRLHKFLFNVKFKIATDHSALQFIFSPDKSLAKNSTAMVQRWALSLSAYNYEIEHRSGKSIPHADFLSRYSKMSPPEETSDALLLQPLPVSRQDLLKESKHYFSDIVKAVKSGWITKTNRKFPEFYKHREEISLSPDGILFLNDRIVIPPTLRKPILDDLHSCHLGIEKMKSLARQSVWWPELNSDIARISKNCNRCHLQVKSKPSMWSPWPLTCEPWQRIHADYCGPFLQKYYALIIIDSFSKWPEVFLTTNADAEFSMQAFRKVFSREGVPLTLVTDNGTHFTAKTLQDWLKGIGCKHLFTPPRHPQSNGLAENFVKTLKKAVSSMQPTTFANLDKSIDSFLLQYRNATHSTTNASPALLFKRRVLRSNMRCVSSAEVSFTKGNDFRLAQGIVLEQLGNRMVRILDLEDGSQHRRHYDQINFQETSNTEDMSGQEPKIIESCHDHEFKIAQSTPTTTDNVSGNTEQNSIEARSVPENDELQSPTSHEEIDQSDLPETQSTSNDGTNQLRRSKRIEERKQRINTDGNNCSCSGCTE